MDWLDGLDTDTLLRTMEKELQNELPGFSIRQLFEKLLNWHFVPQAKGPISCENLQVPT